MGSVNKARCKEGPPNIKSISSIQRKCTILQDAFFPVNVDTPPLILANWLAPPIQNANNTSKMITSTEIEKAIRRSKPNSPTEKDNISYSMMPTGTQASRDLLPSHFTNLLSHKCFPAAWKEAKCILICKAGRTNTSDPKNLRPISLLL